MVDKIDIFDVLGAADLGARDLWDTLTDEQRNQVVFYTLNRWCSSVNGSRESQELAVLKTNEYMNKYHFELGSSKLRDNRKLMWYLMCMSGDTGKAERHNWIKLKKQATTSKKTQLIQQLNPTMGSQEVQLLATLTTDAELNELVQEHGLDPSKKR